MKQHIEIARNILKSGNEISIFFCNIVWLQKYFFVHFLFPLMSFPRFIFFSFHFQLLWIYLSNSLFCFPFSMHKIQLLVFHSHFPLSIFHDLSKFVNFIFSISNFYFLLSMIHFHFLF